MQIKPNKQEKSPLPMKRSPLFTCLPASSLRTVSGSREGNVAESGTSHIKFTRYRSLAFLMVASLGAPFIHAQSSVSETDEEEAVFELSPFEVSADSAARYGVKDTLAGARIRTALKDTPSSLSVVTAQFLEDVNVNNAEDLFVYTMNTEVAGLNGNFSGMTARGQGLASGEGTRLNNPGGVNRARGLTGMDSTRNYFPSEIPWDGYNIDRVDISRGPNSFLFGTGSPSGISNYSTKVAVFDDFGSVEFNVGSYGSTRESLDYNKQLTEELAVRLDLVNSNTRYQQEPAYRDTTRGYVALRYEPKFLRTETAYTKIQANYEHGEVNSNNPRTLPPIDYVTGYLSDPNASATGYNPWTYTMDTSISVDPSASLWSSSGSLSNQFQWGNGSPQYYYDMVNGYLQGAGQSSFTSPTGNGYTAFENTYNVHSSGYYNYARASNYLYRQQNGDVDGGAFAGAYRGTVKYFDQTLSDPSVFDFYNSLIDGDNKHEWQDWDAYNVNIVQSLFDERLVVQAVADHQNYNNGDTGIMGNPLLVLDLNSHDLKTPTWLDGATTNPNVGRPAVFGDQGRNNFNNYERENYQVTAAYNLDFERDFGVKDSLGSLLGRHDFTLLGGRYTKTEEHRNYRLNGVDPSYQILSGNKLNPLPIDNGFNWLAYLGPSMLGGSPAGANLTNLNTVISPPSSYPYTVFSKEWTAGSSVDPSDPWVFTGRDGTEVTQVQADNPANYRGYVGMPVSTLYGDENPAVLATGGNQRSQRLTSKAFLYQGHFWNDTIIPSYGYREDTTLQRGNDSSEYEDPVTKIRNLDYDITDTGVEATTTSTSYGVAVHLPKSIKDRLPSGTDVSLYYFHGENETPRIRYAIDGSQLPNESGVTDDYSVQFDGLGGRLSARLTYFVTKNQHANASVGQPLGTFMIRALPEWVLTQHAYSMAHGSLPKDDDGYFVLPSSDWATWTKEGWANWPYGWMADHPEEAAAANQAMMNEFTELYPQEYWDAYGYNINVEAIKAGDWFHVINGTDAPSWESPFLGGGDTIHGEYPTISQNLESKGYELELTFKPMDNWDITFNGSKVDATQTGLGESAQKQLQGMADVFLGSGVQYAGIWGGYEGAKNSFLSDLWAPYLTQIALIGTEQPEMRKYRFNFITNYGFDEGWAKGLNVGGAFRWEDRAILSYGIHETEIYGETAWIADVDQPLYGPSNEHIDLWAGYEHALNDNVDWKVQFNVRNVGESTGLVPVAYQPNGEIAQQRITTGAEYNLSVKFMF